MKTYPQAVIEAALDRVKTKTGQRSGITCFTDSAKTTSIQGPDGVLATMFPPTEDVPIYSIFFADGSRCDLDEKGVTLSALEARIDVSIAKQLQRSMELNARMKVRLLRVRANMRACPPDGSDVGWAVAIAADEALEEILQDKDPPAWPI